jgi:hypothetical protein
VLASNAGLSHLQPLQDTTVAQVDEMLAVNLRARSCWPSTQRAPCGNGGPAGPCSPPLGRRAHRRHHRPASRGVQGRVARTDHFPASRLAATGATVNAQAQALAAETRMLPGAASVIGAITRCAPPAADRHALARPVAARRARRAVTVQPTPAPSPSGVRAGSSARHVGRA